MSDLAESLYEDAQAVAERMGESRKANPVNVEWETGAKNLLKAELKRKGITYAQLAEALKGLDIHETERNLNNKISRGGIQCCVLVAMSRSYWRIIGFCLVLASGEVFGQELTQPSQADNSEQRGAESAPTPIPIVIVQPDDEAAHDQEREQKSDQHEAADLLAQQQAASAAERSAIATEGQLGPVWMSVYLSAIAAILSAIALGVSGWTAWRTDRTSRNELRPYLVATPEYAFAFAEGKRVGIRFRVENMGHTPALNIRRSIEVFLSPTPVTSIPTGHLVVEHGGHMAALARGQSMAFSRMGADTLSAKEISDIVTRTLAVCAVIRVRYDDVFGASHDEEIAVVIGGDDKNIKNLASDYAGKDLEVVFTRVEGYGTSS